MKENLVVHFGAGALGRGLVVPLLKDSGYDVVIVDTNEELNKQINLTNSYMLDISDEEADKRNKEIRIIQAVSPINDKEILEQYLKGAKIVTTSVRRENLIHVARALASIWGKYDIEGRKVICCENVEDAGSYFKSLLVSEAKTNEEIAILNKIIVPDTIVDRICATSPSNINIVTSEKFHECSVDINVLSDTKIKLIPAVENIKGNFYRKRYLLNAYADAISFIALDRKLDYLYEAATNEEINEEIKTYMKLLKKLLNIKYNCNKKELDKWAIKYRKRLSNKEIPRKLDTVARNLWGKLTLEERFVSPLIELMDEGVNIEDGVKFIIKLINSANNTSKDQLSKEQLIEKLNELWSETKSGQEFYKDVLNLL